MLLPNHLNDVRGFRGLVGFRFIPYQLLLPSCDYFGGSYYPLEASALHRLQCRVLQWASEPPPSASRDEDPTSHAGQPPVLPSGDIQT